MNNRVERVLVACRVGLLGLLLSLAACGPGSGGTGTGPEIGGLTFSSAPGSGGGTPAGAPTTPAGGCNACQPVDLQLQVGSVELVTGCGRFVFLGNWVTDTANQALLPGRFETPGNGRTVPAVLRLKFSEAAQSSRSVIATLTDEAGNLLLEPITLQRAETLAPRAPSAASCPA